MNLTRQLRIASLVVVAGLATAAALEENLPYPYYHFLLGVTITVKPDVVPHSGLNAIPGETGVTIQAETGRYIDNLKKGPLGSPAALYKELPPSDPCPTNDKLFRVHPFLVSAYQVPPQFPNDYRDSNVSQKFTGSLVGCSGSGTAPDFEARIVNIDLDVDSDNDSDDPFHKQKSPSSSLQEDKVEWPVGDADLKLPGLLLVVNHGYEESNTEPERQQITETGKLPSQDFEKTGAKKDDIDLSVSWMRITGVKDPRQGYAKPTYPSARMRLYRVTSGSSSGGSGSPDGTLTYWPSGEDYRCGNGSYELRLEGIDPGRSDLRISYTPDDNVGPPAMDQVKITFSTPYFGSTAIVTRW